MLTRDENHIYRWNKVITSGVNEILKASGVVNFDHIPADKREIGMHFGRVIHATTSLWDADKLDYDLVVANDKDAEFKVIPFLNGWRKFRKDYNISKSKIISNEKMLYSKERIFAGQHDRVIRIQDFTMLDIKLYANSKSGGDLQTAGYSILWDENYPKKKIKNRIVVKLTPNDYGINVFSNKSDYYDFLVALQCHNLRKKRGLL